MCRQRRLRPRLRALRRRQLIAVEPARHVVVEELLAPDHPGQRLAQDVDRPRGLGFGQQLVVEHPGLRLALGEDHFALGERRRQRLSRDKVMPMITRLLRLHADSVMRSRELGAGLRRIDRAPYRHSTI